MSTLEPNHTSRKSRKKPLSRERTEELRVIREALEAAVARLSLRGVAREVGMTPTGLQGVLDGTHPYGKTWDKLRVWFAVTDKSRHELPGSLAAGLLRRLMHTIPDRQWPQAQVLLLEAVERIHHDFRIKRPGWVAEVRWHAGVEARTRERTEPSPPDPAGTAADERTGARLAPPSP